MQRLVIPVADKIALTWQHAAPEKQMQLISLFCWLVEQPDWQNYTPQRFAQLLDQASDKAAANGLTPEVFATLPSASDLTDEERRFMADLLAALRDVELHQEGKIQLKTAQQLIAEL